MKRNNRNNKAVSTVYGSLLFLILISIVLSALFFQLNQYDSSIQTSIIAEQTRAQEKIIIDSMQNDSQTQYVTAIHVNNTGPIAIKLAAIYLESTLLKEISIDLNPKEAIWIPLLPSIPFDASSKITVTTERGVKTTIKEGDLISIYPPRPPKDAYFGPLKLDFEKFYYTQNLVEPRQWHDGWNVPAGTNIVWQITVTNIDNRDVTLNQYSCFTLVPNKQGAQLPWYIEKIEHPANPSSNSLTIVPQETVKITYRYSTPSGSIQGTPAQGGQFRVLLTFFGTFTELDSSITPYGQTIPFEAVRVT